ncbi:MAG: hypothetical protein C4293_15175 [Nitrospiraceae bacterium]
MGESSKEHEENAKGQLPSGCSSSIGRGNEDSRLIIPMEIVRGFGEAVGKASDQARHSSRRVLPLRFGGRGIVSPHGVLSRCVHFVERLRPAGVPFNRG